MSTMSRNGLKDKFQVTESTQEHWDFLCVIYN